MIDRASMCVSAGVQSLVQTCQLNYCQLSASVPVFVFCKYFLQSCG